MSDTKIEARLDSVEKVNALLIDYLRGTHGGWADPASLEAAMEESALEWSTKPNEETTK